MCLGNTVCHRNQSDISYYSLLKLALAHGWLRNTRQINMKFLKAGNAGGTGPFICLALAGLSLLPSQVQSEDGGCITPWVLMSPAEWSRPWRVSWESSSQSSWHISLTTPAVYGLSISADFPLAFPSWNCQFSGYKGKFFRILWCVCAYVLSVWEEMSTCVCVHVPLLSYSVR